MKLDSRSTQEFFGIDSVLATCASLPGGQSVAVKRWNRLFKGFRRRRRRHSVLSPRLLIFQQVTIPGSGVKRHLWEGRESYFHIGGEEVEDAHGMTCEGQKKPKSTLLSQIGFLAPINSQVCWLTRAVNASGYIVRRRLMIDETNWPRFLLPTVTDTSFKTWAIPSGNGHCNIFEILSHIAVKNNN